MLCGMKRSSAMETLLRHFKFLNPSWTKPVEGSLPFGGSEGLAEYVKGNTSLGDFIGRPRGLDRYLNVCRDGAGSGRLLCKLHRPSKSTVL